MADVKKDQLARLECADWATIEKELGRYADQKVRAKRWRTGAFLPKGMEPADLAAIVIAKTFNAVLGQDGPEYGGYRNWNELRYPVLLDHLKAGVDSEVSKLVRSEEHKKVNYSANLSADEAHDLFEDSVDKEYFVTEVEDAESEQIDLDDFEEFERKLFVMLADDDISIKVLNAYRKLAETSDAVKPAHAAELLGVKIEIVRNAVRRISRAADKVKKELDESSYGK